MNTLSNKTTLKSKRCINELYKILYDAYLNKNNTKIVEIKKSNRINFPRLVSNLYFPSEIIEHIKKHGKTNYHIHLSIGNRKIIIYLMEEKKFDFKKYLPYLQMWFYILNKYAPSECTHTLHLYLYLTSKEKNISDMGVVLNSSNINSAYTEVCSNEGEMVIFRYEEWFKSLLHECIHSYGMDFSLMDQSEVEREIRKVFPVNLKEMRFSETYTEMMAEVLNCVFIAFDVLEVKGIFQKFFLYMEWFLARESYFSLAQSKKILHHYGLDYKKISNRNFAGKFKQETHVFEYFILRGILFSNYNKFLEFILENQKNLLVFEKKEKNIKKFFELIKNIYSEKKFLEMVEMVEIDSKNKTLRMSINEL